MIQETIIIWATTDYFDKTNLVILIMGYHIVFALHDLSPNSNSANLDCIRLTTIDFNFITAHYIGLQALNAYVRKTTVRLNNIVNQHERVLKVDNQSIDPTLKNYEVDRQQIISQVVLQDCLELAY